MVLTTRLLEEYYKKLYDEISRLSQLATKARTHDFNHHQALPASLTLGFHERIKNIKEFDEIRERILSLSFEDGNFLQELLHLALSILQREYGTKGRLNALVLVAEIIVTVLTRGMILPGFEHRFQLSIDPSRQHLKLSPNLLLLSLPKFHLGLMIFILDYFRRALLLEPFRTTDSYVNKVLELMKRYLPTPLINRLSEDRIIFLLRKIDIELVIPDETSTREPGMWFRLMESLMGLQYILEAIAENATKLFQWLEAVEYHDDWEWLISDVLSLPRKSPEFPLYLSESAMLQKIALEHSPLARMTLTFHPVLGRTDFMSTNTVGIHPAALYLLPGGCFGTHFALKFPKKTRIVQVIPTLKVKGPLIELKDGTIQHAPEDVTKLEKIKNDVIRVLCWGEMLIPLGLLDEERDVSISFHSLDEDSWRNLLQLRLEEQKFLHGQLSTVDVNEIKETNITEDVAMMLSTTLDLYLPSSFHLYWDQISIKEIITLLSTARITQDGSKDENKSENIDITWEFSDEIRQALININATFQIKKTTNDDAAKIVLIHPRKIFLELITKFRQRKEILQGETLDESNEVLPSDFLASISGIHFFPSKGNCLEASYFPLASMYLPPASLEAHGLFPINGSEAQSTDLYQRVKEEDEIIVRLPTFSCHSCQHLTWKSKCPKCGRRTTQVKTCQNDHPNPLDARTCNQCQLPTLFRRPRKISIKKLLDELEQSFKHENTTFHALRKLSNMRGLIEAPEKGFLRAKHGLKVARDGTIHWSTHLLPTTRVPLSLLQHPTHSQLKKLGYFLSTPTSSELEKEKKPAESTSFELYPSDIVIPRSLARDLLKTAQFVRDWLDFLGVPRLFPIKFHDIEHLIGQYVIFYPQTGHVATCCRIIGITDKVAATLVHPNLVSSMLRNVFLGAVHVVLLQDYFLNFSPELMNVNEMGTAGFPLVLDLIEPYSLNFTYIDGLLLHDQNHVETNPSEKNGYPPVIIMELMNAEPNWDHIRAISGLNVLRKTPSDRLFGLRAPLQENIKKLIPWLVTLSQKTMMIDKSQQTPLEHRTWMLNYLLELLCLIYQDPNNSPDFIREAFIDELTNILHQVSRQYLLWPVECQHCGHRFRNLLTAEQCPHCNLEWKPRITLNERLLASLTALKKKLKDSALPLPPSLKMTLSSMTIAQRDVLQ